MKKRLKRFSYLLLALIAAAAFFLYRFPQEIGRERFPAQRFGVIKVLDGDTADLIGGDRLRLLGIDSPERGEPYHDEATELLARLSLGKEASVVFSKRRRDRYERLLGYLYTDDSLFVNKAMVDSGMATVYLFSDNDLSQPQIEELLLAQRSAIERGVGIWSLPVVEEDYYLSSAGSHRFHRPSCPDLSNDNAKRAQSIAGRKIAFADGLSPCRTCKP